MKVHFVRIKNDIFSIVRSPLNGFRFFDPNEEVIRKAAQDRPNVKQALIPSGKRPLSLS